MPTRVVALGASNLTRGFPALVSIAREAWGPDVELFLALGLGRSYGVASRIGVRTLPGIRESGIWAALAARPRATTHGLLTDVGNDILYGFTPDEILAWVEEAAERLQSACDDVTITGLPLPSIEDVPQPKFLLFRSLLVPRCRLSRATILERARRVEAGLAALAKRRGFRFVALPRAWYGFDPVHIRPSLTRPAWRAIVGGEAARGSASASWPETFRLQALAPERQWLLGVERRHAQGVRLRAGGAVFLY